MHRYWVNSEDAVCGISHQSGNKYCRPRRTKERKKNIWKTRFREFLWSCFWASLTEVAEALSALVCLFVCWLVVNCSDGEKQLTFLSSVFINCVTNFKAFSWRHFSMGCDDKRHRDDQTEKKNSQKNWSEKRKIK